MEILEAFSKAYLAETGFLPSEVELVCEEINTDEKKIVHNYYFRRKK